MAEDSYQLPVEGISGKIVRFIRLTILGQPRFHEVNINATPDGTLYDARGGFNTLVAAQDVNITTAAAAFASQVCTVAVIVADMNNTDMILIGDSSIQPIQLSAGDKISIPINDVGKVYRKSVSGIQTAGILALQ